MPFRFVSLFIKRKIFFSFYSLHQNFSIIKTTDQAKKNCIKKSENKQLKYYFQNRTKLVTKGFFGLSILRCHLFATRPAYHPLSLFLCCRGLPSYQQSNTSLPFIRLLFCSNFPITSRITIIIKQKERSSAKQDAPSVNKNNFLLKFPRLFHLNQVFFFQNKSRFNIPHFSKLPISPNAKTEKLYKAQQRKSIIKKSKKKII